MFYQEVIENVEVIQDYEHKLAELEECIDSEDHETIRTLARSNLLELFRNAISSPEDMKRVLQIMNSLSEHPDSSVRLVVMEKLPRLALLCCSGDRLDIINTHLWPMLLSCLSDKNEKVRKTSEISLLVLIKGKLLEQEILDEQVCPCVIEISELYNCSSTVALMGKMAPLIGKEATKKYFLDRFIHLCSDEEPLVREMCAKSFGDICTVLGTELTEKYLLPLFVRLCRDENWLVRACCAEVCLSVSCSCSLSARKTVLAAAFTDLLMDTQEWVRMSAYKFLGAFICTFADPSVIKLDYDENGELIFMGQEGYEFRIQNIQFHSSRESPRDENLVLREAKTGNHSLNISNALRFIVENGANHFNLQGISSNQRFMNVINQSLPEISWLKKENGCITSDRNSKDIKEEEKEADDLFNTFRFWRTPLPPLDSLELEPEHDEIRTNLNILDNELTSLSVKLAECSNVDLQDMRNETTTFNVTSPDSGWSSAETTPHVESVDSVNPRITDVLGCQNTKIQCGASNPILPSQQIVPQRLLDHFVSLTVSLETELMDKEIAQDCAYCLPAVALTLGSSNWPYIKNAFKCLSMNIKWTVRRTVVSSIHKLASILGEEIASEDLAPIFEGFIRDLDEVKIGALEHLADFLKLLKPNTRNAFLPRLKEFLDTELDYNWRYREEFGEQLRLLIGLFGPLEWLEHFEPLAILLLCDKVAAVRQKAVLLFMDLIVHLSSRPDYQEKLLYTMLKEFAKHTSWRRRQVFVLLCSEIAKQKALDIEDFCTVLLDHLLLLSKDEVPNVGICVARCLSDDIVGSGYVSPSSPYFTSVIGTLEMLKNSEDPDIRYFASSHDENKDRKPFSNVSEQGAVI